MEKQETGDSSTIFPQNKKGRKLQPPDLPLLYPPFLAVVYCLVFLFTLLLAAMGNSKGGTTVKVFLLVGLLSFLRRNSGLGTGENAKVLEKKVLEI